MWADLGAWSRLRMLISPSSLCRAVGTVWALLGRGSRAGMQQLAAKDDLAAFLALWYLQCGGQKHIDWPTAIDWPADQPRTTMSP